MSASLIYLFDVFNSY